MSTVKAGQIKGSISLSYAVKDVEFQLYRIGELDAKNNLKLTGDFADYAIDLNGDAVALTLESFVKRDNPAPIAKASTDENKVVTFENLDNAVYLLCGDTVVENGVKYTAAPSMVSIPSESNGTILKDISIQGKYDKEESSQKVNITVIIIWDDNNMIDSRPPEIEISLLKDKVVYDTVKLNKDNNWKHQWIDLDPNAEWTIAQVHVPPGYKVSVERDGMTYIIVNKLEQAHSSQPTTPPSSSVGRLPQTGLLWWPVLTLICIGLFFLMIGLIYKRKDC